MTYHVDYLPRYLWRCEIRFVVSCRDDVPLLLLLRFDEH